MKKTAIFALLLVMGLALSAQTGLFELSFGDTPEAAVAKLEKEGFEIASNLETYIQMISLDNALVEYIDLNFSAEPKTLVGWTVVYLAQEDEDIEEVVVDALVSWHGEDYEYDYDYEEYWWLIDYDHSVYAYYDDSYVTFWVVYEID